MNALRCFVFAVLWFISVVNGGGVCRSEEKNGALRYRLEKKYTLHASGPAAFSLDGKVLATAGAGRDHSLVKVWDVTSGKCECEFDKHSDAVMWLSFSGDGAMLVSCSKDRSAVIWNLKKRAVQAILQGHRSWV